MTSGSHCVGALLAVLAMPVGAVSAEPQISTCEPIIVSNVHRASPAAKNDPFPRRQRLGLIENGTVPCIHGDRAEPTRCAFLALDFAKGGKASGHWVEDKQGRRFAPIGQTLTKEGRRGGMYVVAALVTNNTVPCIEYAASRDVVGTSGSVELDPGCITETMGSSSNASGRPLRNYATIPVCTTSHPHPDGATLQSANKAAGTYCYIGEGAGLNDHNGRERDQRGNYLTGAGNCHVGWSGGVEVFVGKRPATIAYPPPGRVNPNSPIVWRPITSVRVAN
jgi:hypothetical protein